MPKISIIVPVYNTEKYLPRCIDSILAQTFTDFELILVDDGSTDSSGRICDEYAAKDNRVRVIYQPNAGASAARNRGLEEAAGEYIMFCDSDDAVSPEWIARLMEYAAPDTMAVGSYCSSAAKLGRCDELSVDPGRKYDLSEYYDLNKAGLAGYICNSIFTADIIKQHNLRFRERRDLGDYNEDLLFVLHYVNHIRNIVYTGYSDYFYDTHAGSLSRKYNDLYFRKYEEKFHLWHDFLISHGSHDDLEHLSDAMIYHFLVSMNYEITESVKSGKFGEHYAAFRAIVRSDTVQKCLRYSECRNENPRIINLLKKQASVRLWTLLYLSYLKGTHKS